MTRSDCQVHIDPCIYYTCNVFACPVSIWFDCPKIQLWIFYTCKVLACPILTWCDCQRKDIWMNYTCNVLVCPVFIWCDCQHIDTCICYAWIVLACPVATDVPQESIGSPYYIWYCYCTVWRRGMGHLIFIGHFPQKSHISQTYILHP